MLTLFPLRRKLQLLMLGPFQYAFLKIMLTIVGLFLIPDGIFDPSDVSQERAVKSKTCCLWVLELISEYQQYTGPKAGWPQGSNSPENPVGRWPRLWGCCVTFPHMEEEKQREGLPS